ICTGERHTCFWAGIATTLGISVPYLPSIRFQRPHPILRPCRYVLLGRNDITRCYPMVYTPQLPTRPPRPPTVPAGPVDVRRPKYVLLGRNRAGIRASGQDYTCFWAG